MTGDRSRELYGRALSVLPGGVNSPVRAVRPYPRFVERGDGAHVVDVDGERYLDYVMGYGPLLLGHDPPEPVEAAVQSHASSGPMYGAPTEVEVELAEFLVRHVPSVEMVRFVNSGTEATTSAVRLARGHTGRDKVVVVEGGYHGAQESTLVEPAGDGRRAAPASPGVPDAFAAETLVVPFNDAEAARETFEAHGHEIAAVLVEPVLGNTGVVRPVDGYHRHLRELCDEYGSLLVFDEVLTGFRIGGLGCAQSAIGVTPDVTTFGKVVGGGFPVGAIGGRADVIRRFAPAGNVSQAGTFSGHPVTMAAGLETLRYAARNDVHDRIDDLAADLRAGLTDLCADHAPAYTVVGAGSIFKTVFTRDGPADLDGQCGSGCEQRPACPRYDHCPTHGGDVDAAATDRWERLFRPAMLEEGVLLTADQFEAQFLSAAHTAEDVEATLEAYKAAL